jgi:hypothetical protein
MLALACGDDSGGTSSDTTAGSEATTETTAADDGGDAVEESAVMADFDTVADVADPAGGPLFPPGTATAWWYTAGDVYAVVYTGVDVDVVGLTCPGNSLGLADGSFDFVSNAPLAEGDCGDIPVDPGAEARLCDGTIVYTTVIPVDAEGMLTASFGGIEPGQGAGVASVEADPAAAPELDPAADAYAFPESMGGPVAC